MTDAGGDRIHPPTPRRREQARQQGQVARSRDLVACSVLIAGAVAVWLLGEPLLRMMEQLAVQSFGLVPGPVSPDQAAVMGQLLLARLATVLIPLLGLLFLAALIAHLAQIGFLFLPNRLAPDMERLDPRTGARRMFGAENWLRTAGSAAKLVLLLGVVAWSVGAHHEMLLGIAAGEPPMIAQSAARIFGSVTSALLLALLLLASLDYAWQRWRHERRLWMTDQELREQWRDEQVDPRIHRRRSQLQQHVILQQINRETPQAHLVLIAGTSLAVALRYEPASMSAPQVVVKGAGQQAAEIYRVGQQQGIASVEDGPLTRELYRRVPRGGELPPDTFPAIAAHLIELPRFQKLRPGSPESPVNPAATTG